VNIYLDTAIDVLERVRSFLQLILVLNPQIPCGLSSGLDLAPKSI